MHLHPKTTKRKSFAELADSPTRARLSLSADRLALAQRRLVAAGTVPPPEPKPEPKPEPPPAPSKKIHRTSPGAIRVLSELRRAFPSVFRDLPPPLAIGIGRIVAELLGSEFTNADINQALAIWTCQIPYLSAIAAGGLRYDLFGEAAGEVAPEHQERAASHLATRHKAAAERRERSR